MSLWGPEVRLGSYYLDRLSGQQLRDYQSLNGAGSVCYGSFPMQSRVECFKVALKLLASHVFSSFVFSTLRSLLFPRVFQSVFLRPS
jgi:hypothetical protein